MAVDEPQIHNEDEALLAKLGYKQDLNRSWSGFSNFAISFSIISILAGCLTNFGVAMNNGGPIMISWSWPILSLFILIIGFTMSELVSAYPTSGGIYWWASKLGGPAAGFFTGWLNLIGLIAVTAGVSYGCATFIDLTLTTYSASWAENYSLNRVFIIFVVVLALAASLNIFSSHLMAVMNNVSVWWHVVGASIIVLILIFVPDQHQSFSYVFTERFNNSGYFNAETSTLGFWFVVVPFGFLLTQYTITGFDACAHLSEETSSASSAAAKGIWRSIFYSAIGGYILLLCVVFAIPDDASGNPDNALAGLGVQPIFLAALDKNWATLVLFISASAQFYCATSCLTSASRMTFAFSRDRAIPGSRIWSALTPKRVPANAVMGVAVAAAIVTLPALIKVNIAAPRSPAFYYPVAFYAVTSIAVIGLYASFAIPIFLRWRLGDAFEAGQWNNGPKYKWMNLVAVAEIVIVLTVPDDADPARPATRSASPTSSGSSSTTRRSSPSARCSCSRIWWHVSAKKWFTGPIQNIDPTVAEVYEAGT